MSRYLILVLLNLPLIVAAIISSFVSYKLENISKRRLIFNVIFWLSLLLCLILAEAIYAFLYSEGLTQTEPLSLFDVIQITAIVLLLYVANRTRSKLEAVERKFQDLHQEISIKLSKK